MRGERLGQLSLRTSIVTRCQMPSLLACAFSILHPPVSCQRTDPGAPGLAFETREITTPLLTQPFRAAAFRHARAEEDNQWFAPVLPTFPPDSLLWAKSADVLRERIVLCSRWPAATRQPLCAAAPRRCPQTTRDTVRFAAALSAAMRLHPCGFRLQGGGMPL